MGGPSGPGRSRLLLRVGEPTWSDAAPSLGFQGQPTDPATGLVDMTTRSYVPSLGRFASRDVLFGGYRHPLSLNQWIYGADDPVYLAPNNVYLNMVKEKYPNLSFLEAREVA